LIERVRGIPLQRERIDTLLGLGGAPPPPHRGLALAPPEPRPQLEQSAPRWPLTYIAGISSADCCTITTRPPRELASVYPSTSPCMSFAWSASFLGTRRPRSLPDTSRAPRQRPHRRRGAAGATARRRPGADGGGPIARGRASRLPGGRLPRQDGYDRLPRARPRSCDQTAC
jgi:hypothetical protein